jgi:hypothetical protein
MTLKSNYMHLIHQVDLTCDGKTVRSSSTIREHGAIL